MTRDEAQEALGLIRDVVSKVHDGTVAQNWGVVMILIGTLDLAAFGVTQALASAGVVSAGPYATTWGTYLVLALVANLAVRTRMGGTMTYVERHIWANGVTFYLAAFALVGIDVFFLGTERALEVIPAHLAVVGAVSFSFMSLLDIRYLVYTVLFFAIAALLALWPDYGFAVTGVAWFVSLVIPGVQYVRERRRLIAAGDLVQAR